MNKTVFCLLMATGIVTAQLPSWNISTSKVHVTRVAISEDSLWIWFDGYWSEDWQKTISASEKNSFGIMRRGLLEREWHKLMQKFESLEGTTVVFRITTSSGWAVRGGSPCFGGNSTTVELSK